MNTISVHADDSTFEKLGELEFECPHGWIIHKANCYKKVDVEMTFNEASTTCNLSPIKCWYMLFREGAHLLYLANEIEYDEVIAHNAPGMNIWMGYMSCDTATKCVPDARKCDGKLDCLDTRDELDCPNYMNYIDVETSGSFSTRTLYSGQQRIWTMKAPIGRRIKLNRFTGTVSAGVYLYSDNNYMTVRLYANNRQQDFNAKTLSYTADNTNIFLGYKDLDATVALKSLTFPYQGMEYKPKGLHLRWRITALGGDYITYYVEPIDKTKPTSGKIRGGMTYLEPGDVRVTGRKELHITMEGVPENLQLMYKSGCGDITLMHEYGTIQLFDELIPNNATCTWTLKGGEAVGRGLALKFMNDLYDDPRTTSATKSMDIFTIEGSGGTKTEVENYPEMIYHSSDGTFKVTFQSDVVLNSKSSSFDFGADCPTLEVSEQTEMNKNTTYFNEHVVLICPTGYDFHLEKYAHRESLNLMCTKGSWYIDGEKVAAIPECRDVFCGIPPKVKNGHLVSVTGAKYLSEATYACDPGFKIIEGTTGLCSNIGVWIHLPVCVAMGSNCSTLENCDTAILVCDVMTGTGVCQNGGLCTNGLETASCECKSDYDVLRCYFDEGRVGIAGGTETLDFIQVQSLDECKSRCLNNPNCGDMVFVTSSGQFHCFLYEREKFVSTSDESTRMHYRRICPTDYTGDSCEQVKDWCSEGNNPCENGGECTPKGPVGYMCMCKPGYSGVTCNIDADPCGTNPCAGVARCQSTVTEYICQCEQGKIFTGSQCRDDPTIPVILVNNLYGVLDAPTLQTPFRWINKTISIMFMIRDYMYWISVSRRGIGIKTNMSPWLGVTFNEDFGSELGDGSWHHLGIAINENGMLSATLDAITIDDAVEVVSPPAGEKNVQISLGYLNLAEYQDVSIWDVTLTSRDFALASVGTQPSVNPIQGWWNYDPKTSGMRLTERLLHNLLDDPNINFPQMNCDGFENIMHLSAEGVVDRDTFVGKIEEVKENTNGTLTFKHSLPPSLTWGFYETVIVDNDECPAARSDDTQRKVCPSGADAVCDLACLDTNEALFAPVPKYISCGTLGVWDTREPYEDLVLPGCTISRDPRNLNINTAVTDTLNDMLMNDINGEKWTGLCTGANCDNLEITKAACIDNTKMFEVEFTLTFASNTITAVGGGETSVLDALRIIILLEKDLSLKEIAEASLLEDTVEISMEEVCGVGYALVMSDKSRACVPCGPGWRYDLEAKECVLCDYGHYQNGFVQTECIPCGNGKSTNFRGAREENDCIGALNLDKI
ncbi:SNED1-like protein [Mya arenaria]|uniref:SNED1-like protein n=1 Tax=Mya arenaria TaxID=6604 RepID=A0ABY7DC42_MYAAR|nr:SNED1-like protein [Mya arenaria]